MHVPPFGDLPTTAVVSIETAGDVLGLGRSTAYRQGNDYIASGGTTGIPCFRLAGVLRVPTWALLELALKGRLVRLCDIVDARHHEERIVTVYEPDPDRWDAEYRKSGQATVWARPESSRS